MPLCDSLERFLAALHTAYVDVRFTPMLPSHVHAAAPSLPFSPDLLAWYEQAAPINIELYLFSEYTWLTLYDPTKLADRQLGYRGHGQNPGRCFKDWEDPWLVIGDWSADPVIAHTDQPGTPISMALHGSGSWDLVPVAQDLAAYLAALTISIEFTMIEQPGIYAYDPDTGEARWPAIDAELRERLSTVLEERCLPYWPWTHYS